MQLAMVWLYLRRRLVTLQLQTLTLTMLLSLNQNPPSAYGLLNFTEGDATLMQHPRTTHRTTLEWWRRPDAVDGDAGMFNTTRMKGYATSGGERVERPLGVRGRGLIQF